MITRPQGIIAAIITPVRRLEPDLVRFVRLARDLLNNGCDGLNVLGTTGEATSLSLAQRVAVMRGTAEAGLPLERLLVGTGAAALADATTLTREAARLGFGGALVLPPFYYKDVPVDGIRAYVGALVEATADSHMPIYLYNFPALSGVKYEIALISELIGEFGERIGGLKDSSGDLAYAREAAALADHFDVFPSTEATLGQARDGTFAGCISATVNVNAAYCWKALHDEDDAALTTAVSVRKLFDGKPLVPGVKAVLARLHDDPTLAEPLPPLIRWSEETVEEVYGAYLSLTSEG